MTTTLLVVHLLIVLLLIVIILLQRSAQEGFTGGGGANAMMSGRGKKTLLSRLTAILATLFIGNSLLIAFIYAHQDRKGGLIDALTAGENEQTQPSEGEPVNAADALKDVINKADKKSAVEKAVQGMINKSTLSVQGTAADGQPIVVKEAEVPIAE